MVRFEAGNREAPQCAEPPMETRIVEVSRDAVKTSAHMVDKATSDEMIGSRGGSMFVRNALASILCFGIDVALLGAMVELADVNYLAAATLAFGIAISLHYYISRAWIFRGSDRGAATGYMFFLVNAGIGLLITLAAMAALVEMVDLHYLAARIIASLLAGVATFLLNAKFNFKAL